MTPALSSMPLAEPSGLSPLLAIRIDHYAHTQGSRVYAAVPKTAQLEDGFQDITYVQLARAIDRAAIWLDAQLGDERPNPECYAYVGPRDLRYVAFIVASIKTGRVTLLPSLQLADAALDGLVDKSQCRALFFGSPCAPSAWLDSLHRTHPNLQIAEAPPLEAWFNEDAEYERYAYTKTWETAAADPVFYLHSSGTTGDPKLLTYRNSTLATFDAQYRLGRAPAPPLAINAFAGKRVWSSLSMSHLGGIYANIIHPIYFNTVTVLGPREGPMNARLSDEMIRFGNLSTAWYPPAVLDEIVTRPQSLQLLFQGLETIQYGTAPLNRATAEVCITKLAVQSHYAATENPFPPYFPLDREDWEYFRFHPFAGIEFCYRSNGLFELVILRKHEYRQFQPVFTVLPDLTHFYSKDLWSPHPTKPDLWRYRGRVDDILVLTSGINVPTMLVEAAVQEHPLVRSALIGGEGRPTPFLLVELLEGAAEGPENVAGVLASSIEAANQLIVAVQARLTMGRAVLAPSDRPFCRLAKGSIDRKNTLLRFQKEIEDCYTGN